MRGFKKKLPLFLIHMACWAAFIGYELGLLYYSIGHLEPLYRYVLFYALNIGFFYAQATVLNRTFYRSSPDYLGGVLLWLLLLGGYLLVKAGLDFLLYARPLTAVRPMMPGYLFRAGYFAILSAAYWSSGYIAFYRNKVTEAARKQAELRNAYLEQQISPHMLFNTLNFIYSEVRRNSPDAARSVLLLSDIIRFGLEAADANGSTPVEEELMHLRQLEEINRYRFAAGFYFELTTEGDFSGLRIIPMVLLTLAENLFKHGHLGDPGAPAGILIRALPGGVLYYHSHNRKKSKNDMARRGGTGLMNIKARLDHAYQGRYEWDTSDTPENYTTTLIIHL
ncbi:hypothetical protein BEL04_08595 [Mucilaginibacter sp. PPCGB 2223]|uniref:sensor histidine kinase n=1 Tax=Mucilaginibacter sp. PPCGB 2223 TaxID=1886027 RepID=UPI000824B177|nr:sensor histidine kinase [Mucilaginibacter sp. PPCGB 2223]OCX54307.1 hypothetical protein BEL04_08595 [Mucilaginibacter sp. PPCGB 2223]